MGFPSCSLSSSDLFPIAPPTPYSPSEQTYCLYQFKFPQDPRGPQTPESPPLMSVSAQSHASHFTSAQLSPAQTASQSVPLSSPAPSIEMSRQPSAQTTLATSAFPTPASSVSDKGSSFNTMDESGDSHRNISDSQTQNPLAGGKTDQMELDPTVPTHGKSNHDWQEASGSKENEMGVDQTEALSTSSKLDPQSLNPEIGKAFHLGRSYYAPTGPDPNIDLVSLYGLGPIASTVARTDPVTGEKINRLRKSYEGKIKGLGLAGRNKASRREPSSPNSLLAICSWPEEEWQNQKVIGREMRVAEPDSEQYQRLMKAMKMEPGPLPNQEFWEDALGHEKPAKALPTDLKSNAHLARQSNGGVSPSVSPAPSVAESIRPRRVGKKRSYQDNSFMGYGEGFLDDDADIDPDFHSNDGDEGGKGGKKKRKRDHFAASPLPERGGSYGVGMFVGGR